MPPLLSPAPSPSPAPFSPFSGTSASPSSLPSGGSVSSPSLSQRPPLLLLIFKLYSTFFYVLYCNLINYRAAGRLPLTWYTNDYVKALPMTSMKLRPVEGTILYPFGPWSQLHSVQLHSVQLHPLQPHNLPLHQRVQPAVLQTPHLTPTSLLADEPCTNAINFVVEEKNTGSTNGNHTMLVYLRPPPEVADAPMKQLVGYLKAFVPTNQSANLTFTINACKALGWIAWPTSSCRRGITPSRSEMAPPRFPSAGRHASCWMAQETGE